MSLHPEERPADIESFRKALLGEFSPLTPQKISLPTPTFFDLISSPVEMTLAIVSIGLVLLSFVLTFVR
ncbi:MAG: hypothetical protein ACPL4H_02600 [Anaerolineales bacterium]